MKTLSVVDAMYVISHQQVGRLKIVPLKDQHSTDCIGVEFQFNYIQVGGFLWTLKNNKINCSEKIRLT